MEPAKSFFQNMPPKKTDALFKELSGLKFALDVSSIVAVTDIQGKIISVNDKFCEISKYSREELLGKDHRIVNSGYHSASFFQNLWKTVLSGEVWKGEIRNRAKDGSFYWVDTTIVPLLDKSKKPYQFVAIRNDITQRKEMEAQFKKLPQKIIQAQEEEREQISRDIHDDLGQSLATLKMLIQTHTDEKYKDEKERRKSCERIIRYLNTTIEKSRNLAANLRPSALEVLGLTDSLKTLIHNFHTTKGVVIKSRIIELDDLEFCNEPINLYRIVQEALTNVVNHARATEADIVFSRKKGRVTVKISDNGIGLSSAKEKESRKTVSGLGLLTMQERVNLLEGDLYIESGPKGTVIHLSVPFKESHGKDKNISH